MSLDELYREIILDHNQQPRNRGRLEHPTATVGLFNPTCGDQIRLDLLVEDGRVKDIRFDGQGCSISMASASMMTEAVKGKPVEEALALARGFKAFLRGEPPGVALGDLEVLGGVTQFPSRVKCATLAHNALEKGLTGQQGGLDEE
ncbi:iron-sulfur cluster assembly sulfur-transfer protein [Zn(2+)-dependent] [Candidatus Hydrogenisulfobacillus filiaventi]|uniref:Iron-sulfur cluster assembly sulfur-transfer protein [Zn(2+)-dependent] n=1 Tax=Candidatus Hydrogenisulfobacillus filiaventi TaxID=2707344 RepID=A0A6F8ZG74_9FIRM|nr:SUF system NifU family Fe-S cluster assembly protein [Bacillota bacterium]CAB1128936.1 iron-sulfur cluster assembly sulfur-transfer protein [Zn(2+)-dependent] [Candidatus Hydrogenisulfobacillus filiaventi]